MNNLKATRKIIFCLMFLIMLSFIAGQSFQEYYKIDLNWNKGEFKLNNLDIELSDSSIENPFGFYLADVVDFKNETLNSSFFNVPNEILYDEVDENGTIIGGGILELNETNFTIYVPYYENANEIVIYDENLTERLRIDVSMYSRETPASKGDLEVKEIAREKKKGEKISREGKEVETFTKKLARNWWVFGIILLILVVILIRSFSKKKIK